MKAAERTELAPYRNVHQSINDALVGMSPAAMDLAFYLACGPLLCFERHKIVYVGPAALAEGLGSSVPEVERAAAELEAVGLIKVDWGKREIWARYAEPLRMG
ncbi:MAG TPA: hypothetical protein VMT03_02075 [Polyangia bacterium]|nr:hypothetical protein [Polyangia bacterium]